MATGDDLWGTADPARWLAALADYEAVLARQGMTHLLDYDRWYHHGLPATLAERDPAYLTHDELVLVVKWKMTRGEWRPRNLSLVESNDPEAVEWQTREAFLRVPDLRAPIKLISELAGVGAATASAVLAAYAPDAYPFFDEQVAAQIPDLGPVRYTPAYYARYAERLRKRAAALAAAAAPTTSPPGGWTPHACDLALWVNSGGKAALRG